MNFLMIVVALILLTTAHCWTYLGHYIRGDASREVYQGIKADLLQNLNTFSNKTTAQALRKDLEQSSPEKRVLQSIDDKTVEEIFNLFGLKDPKCDKNNNGMVQGEELKCLNKLWKYYVPH